MRGCVEVHCGGQPNIPSKARKAASLQMRYRRREWDQNEGYLLQPYIVLIDLVSFSYYCFSN